jgi:hypothetical protein
MGQAKRNQQRPCPALGEIITPETCGGNRNCKIPCPGDCPHNPFNPANYFSIYQAIESKVIAEISRMMAKDLDSHEEHALVQAIRKKDIFLINALHVWHIHGQNRIAKWHDQGAFRDWKNDELTMLRSLDTIRVALLEIQRVIDDRATLVRDLLRPDVTPFVLIDAKTAATICRFSVFLTWVYELPGGVSRLSGVAHNIGEIDNLSSAEMFKHIIDHLGAPADDKGRWLLENMPRIQASIAAIAKARAARQFEISDLIVCERTCRIGGKWSMSANRQIRDFAFLLDRHPLIQNDGPDDTDAIFRASLLDSQASDDHPVESIGTITLFPDGDIQLWSLGRKHTQSVLDFVTLLEPTIKVIKEKFTDLCEQKKNAAGPWDPSLVPAALIEHVSSISLVSQRLSLGDENPLLVSLKSSFDGFADKPVPLLDHRSPRDAAAIPSLRPLLVELMKRHVNMIDQQRRTKGIDFDINPLLEELGLHEIIQTPVPCGITDDDAEEDAAEDRDAWN